MPDQDSEESEPPAEDNVSHIELDDLQQLVLERDACFAVSYLLLKHLLLSVFFLMAVFTMVRLTLTDSHVARVTRSDSGVTDSLSVSSNTITVNVTISANKTPASEKVITNATNESNQDVKRAKLTIFMARFSGIIAICFGILGIITESVTLVLLFVLYTSLRLVTTFFIAAFRQPLVSMLFLFIINILSFTFVTLMIIRSWQMCLKPSRMRMDSTKKLADKFESAIEVRITVPEDEDVTGDKKDAIMNALNRRASRVHSVSSFTLSQLNEAFASLKDFELDHYKFMPPPPPAAPASPHLAVARNPHSTGSSLHSNRSSQCIPPRMAAALAASLAHTHPITDDRVSK